MSGLEHTKGGSAGTEEPGVDGTDPRDEGRRQRLVSEGQRVLREEAEAVQRLSERVADDFARAVEILLGVRGRVIVTGVGKSGLVGRKIAATLTSTGTPATFLHPVEGLHGDLGIVSRDDAAIFISKSGETEELSGLLEFAGRRGLPMIAMTGRRDSLLGRYATVVLDCGVEREACPMDLAPTSSTTAAQAMGDALALTLLQEKGFREEDFAHFHPAGTLGRRLTVRVVDVMVRDAYPEVGELSTLRDCVVPIAHMRGTVPVVDDQRRVRGVVTAGDLTRAMDRDPGFQEVPVREVMNPNPKLAREDDLGARVVHEMETHGIMAMPVVDEEERLSGMIHLHDLMRSGVV